MKKSDATEQVITRRKALGRIGLFATAAYTVPAFATLSMAHASSNASSTSSASGNSDASDASDASDPSVASGPSISIPSAAELACDKTGRGIVGNDLTDSDYVQCLIDNSDLLSADTLAQLTALSI
ncbi:MAG: hypothetical protein KAS85_08130 [Rhodobacteraceae bacterium]|nr:hypothetical protein [Paracoccaceae bacterium]